MSGAAEALSPLVHHLCGGEPPLRIRFWDGSEVGPAAGHVAASPGRDPTTEPVPTLVISSPRALRRILWQPNQLGLSRAYVAGEIELEGSIWALFRLPGLLSPGSRHGS